MKFFGVRHIYGKSLDKIVKEYNQTSNRYSRYDFYNRFFTKKENKIIKCVYMTTYQNNKGKQYVIFTNYLPQPSGVLYNSMDSLIGAKTGYNHPICKSKCS